MTDIFSAHSVNYQHFDDMQVAINALAEFRDQLNRLYDTLHPIWIGQTGDAMQAQKQQHTQQVEGHHADLQAHQQWGVNKVADFAALDGRLAGGIGV
jgi:hypothetical protein